MRSFAILSSALLLASSVLASPSRTAPAPASKVAKRAPPGFVTSSGGNFLIDGKPFFFFGTNVYWLSQLNSNDDIIATIKEIAANNYTVIRTWCFREVVAPTTESPEKYTTLWNGSEQTFSDAGLARLKLILDTADSVGVKIQCSLTNNWAPDTSGTGRPAGYYSNSYGGSDTYVKQILGPDSNHDDFYTNPAVIAAYQKFVTKIVPTFKDSKSLLGWELANDPQCRGAEGTKTTGTCNPQTITKWIAQNSAFVKTLDPNHLSASGDSGHYCVDCPKLFPLTPAPAGPSGNGGSSNGLVTSKKRRHGFLTKDDIFQQRREAERAAYRLARAQGTKKRSVRGTWAAPAESSFNRFRARDIKLGRAFDGSTGVDSEDVSNIPTVDYSSFQLFPDQNDYSPSGGDSSGAPDGGAGGGDTSVAIQQGIDWITNHIETAQLVGKPTHLTSFGLVAQSDSSSFLSQDSTNVGIDSATNVSVPAKKRALAPRKKQTKVASDKDQEKAYSTWTSDAISKGINGITHHQYKKKGLKSQDNSVVDNNNHSHQSGDDSSNSDTSPNDGYRATSGAIQDILSKAAGKQKQKSGQDSS